jgi:hypothetical protein
MNTVPEGRLLGPPKTSYDVNRAWSLPEANRGAGEAGREAAGHCACVPIIFLTVLQKGPRCSI